MSTVLYPHSLRTIFRVATAASRAPVYNLRTFATIPDPTHPTDAQSDVPKPKGNHTMLWVVGGLAVVGAGYYATRSTSVDPHIQRKTDEELVKQRAAELRDAGKTTAQDAARKGQVKYDEAKSSAQDKLADARAQANKAAEDARSAASRQYEKVKSTSANAAHKVEDAYVDVSNKTKQEAQGWNAWFWGLLGYSQAKVEDTTSAGAQKVAEGARKVEHEAQKRT